LELYGVTHLPLPVLPTNESIWTAAGSLFTFWRRRCQSGVPFAVV